MNDRVRMGTLLFLASEAVFFALLIIAYIFYRSEWATAGSPFVHALDVTLTGIFTVCLLLSSGTIWLSERSLSRGNQTMMRVWLLATLVLGAVFLAGQGFEYSRLFSDRITLGTGLFGTTFFTLTGFHGLHVLLGLIALGIIFLLALRGVFRGPHSSALAAASLYWHFVDMVWIAVFSVIYLWSIRV